jgi:magnesium transporter
VGQALGVEANTPGDGGCGVAVDDPSGRARRPGRTRRLLRLGQAPRGHDAPRQESVEDGTDRGGIDAVIGDCGVYEDGRRQPGRVPLDQAGEVARTTSGFVWIGLQQPSAEDIAVVADEFGLPSLAVEDAVTAHQRPKLEVYEGVVFAILKPVRYVDHD